MSTILISNLISETGGLKSKNVKSATLLKFVYYDGWVIKISKYPIHVVILQIRVQIFCGDGDMVFAERKVLVKLCRQFCFKIKLVFFGKLL